MQTTPECRVIELFVKIALLVIVYGLLVFLLCGCDEPTFRCSKCRSSTQLIHLPASNGKLTARVTVLRTIWECRDQDTHNKEKREHRTK